MKKYKYIEKHKGTAKEQQKKVDEEYEKEIDKCRKAMIKREKIEKKAREKEKIAHTNYLKECKK